MMTDEATPLLANSSGAHVSGEESGHVLEAKGVPSGELLVLMVGLVISTGISLPQIP